MKIVFLGTSSGVPTKARNVSGIGLSLDRSSELWLFDCGEGTQRQIMQMPDLKLGKLRKIFITHMHGDHIYGLPGLLSTLNMLDLSHQIDIYGPPELQQYIESVYQYSHGHVDYAHRFHATHEGLLFEDKYYRVQCAPLMHRIAAHGFRVEEKDKPGKFDLERARCDNIPAGPIYEQLRNKKIVTLPDGRIVYGKDYVGPDIPGKIMAYCSDTVYCDNAVSLAKNADVLIHEATFLEEQEDLAIRYQHTTANMAAKVAATAQVNTLILTHFSPRYEKGGSSLFLDEAKQVFINTLAAYDGFAYQVSPCNDRD